MESGSGLLVRRIREGTVIDHIPAGRALTVLKILGITGREGARIAVVMNVESRKLGRKDIVKIEGRHLSPEEVDKIALVAPRATINIIHDYRVVAKRRVTVPDIVEGILMCPNPSCITRVGREPVKPRFRVVSRQPLVLQCVYCGTLVSEEDVAEQLAEGG
ncbi:aspartate carbamoyltransferase regulatory subunit [Hyperthermus butylicus]|uniref:Aspartate carbamoyltransferase regulatory chain n=1 Tax=Hyperthermus butylicus (strain DSM 5456 / JCM 9403 / PLM1-5) TaxID=415426 RepID=PYRI_HYPBU|nr:aspartate carbamoyltransferase regulatory subunit [Hyperthermus butylicus]A2BJ23.1 RecName: Full=Aspartate carbamoyltransferase regulatory chain [Hyperthermus butylicus DSM 5456]ABM79984.1 Aspartate carbamoyltransferase regulatory chain [Hyperthermus butylicus DSM 5456]